MKLATIFNPKGERVSYAILKDNEVDGFRDEIAEEGKAMFVADLNDDSLEAALLSCYEEQAFFLATCLFESIYESSIFLGPSNLSERAYEAARMIYDIRDVNTRVEAARAATVDFLS